MNINMAELIESIRVLMQQQSIVDEIKKQNSILEEKNIFNEKDLIKIYFNWRSNFIEISEVEKLDRYKAELEEFKGNFFGFIG